MRENLMIALAPKGACYFSLKQWAPMAGTQPGSNEQDLRTKALSSSAAREGRGVGASDLDWELGRSCLHGSSCKARRVVT